MPKLISQIINPVIPKPWGEDVAAENAGKVAQEYGVKRVIHISSTAVYGVPDHHPLYEHDPVIGVGPYGNAKIQAEAAIRVWQVLWAFRDLRRRKQ